MFEIDWQLVVMQIALFASGLLVGYGLAKSLKGLIIMGLGILVLVLFGLITVTVNVQAPSGVLESLASLAQALFSQFVSFSSKFPIFVGGFFAGIIIAILKGM
jgi:hypothetical protein